jgi:hypothetical protein
VSLLDDCPKVKVDPDEGAGAAEDDCPPKENGCSDDGAEALAGLGAALLPLPPNEGVVVVGAALPNVKDGIVDEEAVPDALGRFS